MLEVKVTKKMGRGVFATKNIKSGTKIMYNEFLKIKDAELDNCPKVGSYAFRFSDKYSIICLGIGSLFNHSDNPSVAAHFGEKDGRGVMEFWTLRDVKSGEELFLSYGGEEYAFKHLLKKK